MIQSSFAKSDHVEIFLARQSGAPLTYPNVGGTTGVPPDGYTLDRTRRKIGQGIHEFEIAKTAIREWEQFQLDWLSAYPTDTPIEVGNDVALVGRFLGITWLNACRIVYTIDEESRFGFAYGTLPSHIGSGEERFLVEIDSDGGVWYDILAFSKPSGILGWMGYRFLRKLQKRFGLHSANRMETLVSQHKNADAKPTC